MEYIPCVFVRHNALRNSGSQAMSSALGPSTKQWHSSFCLSGTCTITGDTDRDKDRCMSYLIWIRRDAVCQTNRLLKTRMSLERLMVLTEHLGKLHNSPGDCKEAQRGTGNNKHKDARQKGYQGMSGKPADPCGWSHTVRTGPRNEAPQWAWARGAGGKMNPLTAAQCEKSKRGPKKPKWRTCKKLRICLHESESFPPHWLPTSFSCPVCALLWELSAILLLLLWCGGSFCTGTFKW